MAWNKYVYAALVVMLVAFVSACSVSYKFYGASIDYTKS